MINTIVVHPNIFNVEMLTDKESDSYLDTIRIWEKFCLTDSDVVITDNSGNIKREIKSLYTNIDRPETIKKLEALFKLLEKRSINVEPATIDFSAQKSCENTLCIVKRTFPNILFMKSTSCKYRDCNRCIKNINSNICLKYSDKIGQWQKTPTNYSSTPGKYSFNELIKYLGYNLLTKYCNEFILYDKNIIPEKSRGITVEYQYNIELFFKFFKNTSITPQIITYVSCNQSEESINHTKNVIAEIASNLNICIDLKILRDRDLEDEYAEQIHQRYIMTNIANFSSDRGLNIINKTTGKNRSFDINNIPYEKVRMFKNYLNHLKPI